MIRPTHPCRVDLNDNRYWRDEWKGVVILDGLTGKVCEDCFMADEGQEVRKSYVRGPDGKLVYSVQSGKLAVMSQTTRGPVTIRFPWENEEWLKHANANRCT